MTLERLNLLKPHFNFIVFRYLGIWLAYHKNFLKCKIPFFQKHTESNIIGIPPVVRLNFLSRRPFRADQASFQRTEGYALLSAECKLHCHPTNFEVKSSNIY